MYRLHLLSGKVLRHIFNKLPLSARNKQNILDKLGKFKWFRIYCKKINAFHHRGWLSWKRDVHRLHYIKDVLRISREVSKNPEYTSKTSVSLNAEKLTIHAIAFYLPQFHPIPENDRFWGTGFTEWTNVTKAVPQFLGHYQPHLPGELGFYDLRLPQVMQQQVALAKQYGIYGFCFYHYWFNGKKLLQHPLNQFLADSTLNIKFCLCWANENWTRRWDGRESDVLIAQHYSDENDLTFINDLAAIFNDKRYIRINNRPLLLIYRATSLPSPKETIQCWRTHIKELGFDGVYLVAVLSLRFDTAEDYIPLGFDAVVDFPPHQTGTDVDSILTKRQILNPDYAGKIFCYQKMVESYTPKSSPDIVRFRGIMPSWDNEARLPGAGCTFVGSTPKLYKKWLRKICQITFLHSPHERIFFINAWNEWAEGAHLEPDRKFGYGYLEATANVLYDYYHDHELSEFVHKSNQQFRKTANTAIILHCYYEDLIEPIFKSYLVDKISDVDLFVTVGKHISLSGLQKIQQYFPNVYIMVCRNHGRDIYPFLMLLKIVVDFGYEIGCKVHTKKSPHRQDGEKLLQIMFNSLLGGSGRVRQAVQLFTNAPTLGLLAPKQQILELRRHCFHLNNTVWLDKLLIGMGRVDLIDAYTIEFPAGSMYWFRTQALMGLDKLVLKEGFFEEEEGQIDGTLAHAVERIVALFAAQRGYRMEAIDD